MSSGRQIASLARQCSFRFASAGILLLAGCSIDSALTPPADVGAVGSIAPGYAALPPPQPVPASFAQADQVSAPPVADSASGEPLPQPRSAPEPAIVDGSPAAPVSTEPGRAADPAEDASTAASVMDSDRVVEGDTRDPVVAGVGTGAPRLVPGTGLGDPDAGETPSLLPKTARRPAAPAAEGETRLAFNVRPADPIHLGRGAAPQSEAMNQPEAMPASEIACRHELGRLGVQYVDLPRISEGPACGIAYPIKLTGLSGGIRIKPAATLNCQVTAEFAKWVKRDVAPAARMRYLSGISSMTQLSSYSCRTMNSEPGAPMSEHAHGNAIDIGSITLNSGRRIDVRKPGWFAFRQRGFLNTVRADSCGYFNTVLGPGTNKYHWNHFHFDLRQRRSGRSYCE